MLSNHAQKEDRHLLSANSTSQLVHRFHKRLLPSYSRYPTSLCRFRGASLSQNKPQEFSDLFRSTEDISHGAYRLNIWLLQCSPTMENFTLIVTFLNDVPIVIDYFPHLHIF